MNEYTVTNRFLRSLVKTKGRLESDLSAVNSTLEKLGGDAIPTRMTAKHRANISRGIRAALRSLQGLTTSPRNVGTQTPWPRRTLLVVCV